MQAGRLRHRLVFETPATTEDTFGEVVDAPYAAVATVWGSVEPLSGREQLWAQQVQAEITHKVRVRYSNLVTPECRIRFGTRYFNILSIINREERNRELEIMCKELV
jgi:SPP1 family predicted phage head-tail adaptor